MKGLTPEVRCINQSYALLSYLHDDSKRSLTTWTGTTLVDAIGGSTKILWLLSKKKKLK